MGVARYVAEKAGYLYRQQEVAQPTLMRQVAQVLSILLRQAAFRPFVYSVLFTALQMDPTLRWIGPLSKACSKTDCKLEDTANLVLFNPGLVDQLLLFLASSEHTYTSTRNSCCDCRPDCQSATRHTIGTTCQTVTGSNGCRCAFYYSGADFKTHKTVTERVDMLIGANFVVTTYSNLSKSYAIRQKGSSHGGWREA